MTNTRYRAYRNLVSSLGLTSLTETEREFLRDAAEGYLLAASVDSDELSELSQTIVVTLEEVVAAGRMSRWSAEHTKAWIEACGPTHEPRLLAGAY